MRTEKGKVIAIEGLIGAGKSTAVNALGQYLESENVKCRVFHEKINMDLLSLFIRDMKKYAFAFQLSTLESRINAQREAHVFAREGGIAILDRSTVGDRAFAILHHREGNINDTEFKVYESTYLNSSIFLPDEIIFLDCSIEISMQRIHRRNRDGETSGYSEKYLSDLSDCYEQTIRAIRMIPVVRATWDTERDAREITSAIRTVCFL